MYLSKQSVQTVIESEEGVLIACLENSSSFKKIKRDTKAVESINISSQDRSNPQYSKLQKVKGYHPLDFPYLISRDLHSVKLLDGAKMEVLKILPCPI